MSYIDRLNCFFHWLENHRLPVHAQVLYLHLLNECNRAFWPDKLHVSNARLMKIIGVGSHNTLDEARKALRDAGLIKYLQGSRSKETQYILCSLPMVSKTDMSESDFMSKSDHFIDILTKLDNISVDKVKRNNYKEYGEYGWVKLTDAQFERLQQDLGTLELDWCIKYVDEAAQATGNKNKWRDWNLVIRKCSREKWGGQSRQLFDRQMATFKPRPEIIPDYD